MRKSATVDPTPTRKSLIEYTDLRSITRRSDKWHTIVTVETHDDTGFRKNITWLEFGEVQLRSTGRESGADGCYELRAYLLENVVDFEHDSAYALSLPLIGVRLGPMAVHYHQVSLCGWIDPNVDDNFRVPRPKYNPMALADTRRDKELTIVPEGFYLPPFDVELYKAVRGKKVEITISPVYKDEE